MDEQRRKVGKRAALGIGLLPVLPMAGLGLLIRSEPEGVRILDVLPGTAASDAELASGDLVTEVDGTSTAGLEPTLDRRELTGG